MAAKDLFYGPAEFVQVFERFDVGTGDRFYTDPAAWSKEWAACIAHPLKSMVVISASRGKHGSVTYLIESWDGAAWSKGNTSTTTQERFRSLISIKNEHET